MKFPVSKCMSCGLDLTTAEPANVKGPGEAPSVGTCPQCSAPYFMVEDSASLLDVPVAELELSRVRGRRRTPEPEPEPEPASKPDALPEE